MEQCATIHVVFPLAALSALLLLVVWSLRSRMEKKAQAIAAPPVRAAPPIRDAPHIGAHTADTHDSACVGGAVEFAQRYPGYGYNGQLAAIQADFAHLARDEVYLDHAGATLCSASQVRRHADAILTNTLGNPHSRNAAGKRTAHVLRRTRELLLQHLNASEHEYAVVFTSGCTGAVQMLAQHFRWTPGKSVLGYALCNHNSVLGMRETAKQHSCPFVVFPPTLIAELIEHGGRVETEAEDSSSVRSGVGEGAQEEEEDMLDTPRTSGWCSNKSDDEPREEPHANLFAFSAECNFSGTKTDLSLVSLVQQGCLDRHLDTHMRASPLGAAGAAGAAGMGVGGKWYVLVDAAKAAATSELCLSGSHRPDFVAVSFYKMMGLPTGLGALVIRRQFFF